MLIFLLCLYCAIQPLINIDVVLGKRDPLPRFLIEDGVKPPIFGSYSYDPIKQIFEIQPSNDTLSKNQIYNDTVILSTAVGYVETMTHTDIQHPTTPSKPDYLNFRKQPENATNRFWRKKTQNIVDTLTLNQESNLVQHENNKN